jgi:hypothetical protein
VIVTTPKLYLPSKAGPRRCSIVTDAGVPKSRWVHATQSVIDGRKQRGRNYRRLGERNQPGK